MATNGKPLERKESEMEFGHMPPMFGMGIVDSASEVIRIQQQAAEQAQAQMELQVQLEALQPPQSAEQAQRGVQETPCPSPK
jgi:hypothetical protein